METNTVLLDVKEYNELRDFKQKIEEGKSFVVISGYDSYEFRFFTTEKAINVIGGANKSLQEENEKLRNVNNPKETTINDIKKMSYWEFRKWRRS